MAERKFNFHKKSENDECSSGIAATTTERNVAIILLLIMKTFRIYGIFYAKPWKREKTKKIRKNYKNCIMLKTLMETINCRT